MEYRTPLAVAHQQPHMVWHQYSCPSRAECKCYRRQRTSGGAQCPRSQHKPMLRHFPRVWYCTPTLQLRTLEPLCPNNITGNHHVHPSPFTYSPSRQDPFETGVVARHPHSRGGFAGDGSLRIHLPPFQDSIPGPPRAISENRGEKGVHRVSFQQSRRSTPSLLDAPTGCMNVERLCRR